MATKPLALSDKQKKIISKEIESGRFRTEEEVLKAGLQLLDQQRRWMAKREKLRKAIQVGIDEIDAGLGVLVTSDEELSNLLRQIGNDARKQARQGRRKVNS